MENNYSAITFNPTPVNFQSFDHQSTNVNGGSGVAGVVTAGLGMLNSYFDRKQERELAEQQRNWNEQMMNTQNQFSLDMWNKTNEYNSPIQQVARLREAGLNPLYYGLDGSSANQFQSAQAMGYDRASMRGLANPIQQGLENYLATKSFEKDIELKNAQIDKMESETTSIGLDNQFKDKTLDARVKAQELANSLSKATIERVEKEKESIVANIKKTIAETENEYAKKLLIDADTNLKNVSAQQIVELLPYQKLLMEAQTDAQKAAASAAYMKAAIDRKLINEGYFDSMIKDMEAKYKNDAAIAAINEFKQSVKQGNIYSIDPNDPKYLKFGKQFVNDIFNIANILGETITGPMASVLKG